MYGSSESVTPTIQGSGDICTCLQTIPATSFVIDSSAPICWGHSFVLRSYPTGLSIREAITMTFSFFRSDKLVYTNARLKPISPCQPTQAMAGPVFSYILNPHPTFPGRAHQFYGCIKSWSAQMWDSQISGSGPVQTTSSSTLWSSRG